MIYKNSKSRTLYYKKNKWKNRVIWDKRKVENGEFIRRTWRDNYKWNYFGNINNFVYCNYEIGRASCRERV